MAAHEPNIAAGSLYQLGIWLLLWGTLGRRWLGALSPTADALAIYERLAKDSRAALRA
ncbi:hypothetical protein GCM10017687_12180 [Streptomyces echinatus]